MPSACCCPGRPHHLTVWGQGRPHPSRSIPWGGGGGGGGDSRNGPLFVSEPRGPGCLSLSQEGLSSERGAVRLGGTHRYRVRGLCPFYRGGCQGHSGHRFCYQGTG